MGFLDLFRIFKNTTPVQKRTILTTEDLYNYSYVDIIKGYVEEFDRKVFLDGGLQDWIDTTEVRGTAGKFCNYRLLTYEIASRVMVTIRGQGSRDGAVEISLVTLSKDEYDSEFRKEEGFANPSLGIQSIYGNPFDVIDMLKAVTESFDVSQMQEDREVKVAGT